MGTFTTLSKPPKGKGLWRLYLSTHFLSLKYERTAITVQITVATQVTAAITISHVIRKPPETYFDLGRLSLVEAPPESGISYCL